MGLGKSHRGQNTRRGTVLLAGSSLNLFWLVWLGPAWGKSSSVVGRAQQRDQGLAGMAWSWRRILWDRLWGGRSSADLFFSFFI